MPLFEFRCSTCSRDFELLVRGSEPAACPSCGTSAIEKLFSESAAPALNGTRSLPVTSACPPGNAPCCRL
jgi:putative FmdB family regulatory protein